MRPHDTDRHDSHRASDLQARTQHGHDRGLGRREFLLAGCSGDGATDAAPPDPVSVGAGQVCDSCGMVISEHPGPNGQIFYREGPSSGSEPARFDSPKACLFPYYFEHERRGWSAEVVYVTDYSRVDYEITTVEGQRYIQTATAPESFSNARDTVFVVGSEVHGAMGADFVPFSERADAESLAEEHGGEVVEYDSIDEGLIGQ